MSPKKSRRESKIPLFLHIGANKTGTSAIQHYLNSQRDALAQAGLLYPRAGCSGEAHYRLSDALNFSHEKLAQDERLALQKEIQDALDAEIGAVAPKSVVMSSENFVLERDIQPVLEFFVGFDLRFVVYLRRHDGWWPSAFNQAVRHVKAPKWGFGLQEFVSWQKRGNPRYGDWRHLVDRWASALGKKRIIVRPYEVQQNQPNIVADFLNIIGYPQLAPSEIPVVNESVDAFRLRMIDIAQRADLDDATRQRIIEYTLRQPPQGKPFKGPTAYLRQLVERYAEDYAYIAREYLGRADGRLFYDSLPNDEEDEAPNLPFPREVMSWTARALAAFEPIK